MGVGRSSRWRKVCVSAQWSVDTIPLHSPETERQRDRETETEIQHLCIREVAPEPLARGLACQLLIPHSPDSGQIYFALLCGYLE